MNLLINQSKTSLALSYILKKYHLGLSSAYFVENHLIRGDHRDPGRQTLDKHHGLDGHQSEYVDQLAGNGLAGA